VKEAAKALKRMASQMDARVNGMFKAKAQAGQETLL
jgi:hypothetical protein